MSHLSEPFSLKNLTLKNRVVMPPMCQYSVDLKDGIPNEWHYVHYVSRAVGGTGLIIVEMTDVEPDGRITDRCLGLWSDDHIPAFKRIIDEVHRYGSKIGIQIAHAGRKAEDTDFPVSSTNVPFSASSKKPRALSTEEVRAMIEKYRDAAVRAVKAGADTVELHGAHGYLIHQFHSPLINDRTDEYGQDYALFGEQIIRAVKNVIPADMPLMIRISAVEYADGGYDLAHSIEIAKRYRDAGVDIFHVSSGGEAPFGTRGGPAYAPGYQVPLARAYREALGVPVIAVGWLDDPQVSEAALRDGSTDLVAVGRGMLRDPYWAVHALHKLDGKGNPPRQYERSY